jgi:UPF0755 protein
MESFFEHMQRMVQGARALFRSARHQTSQTIPRGPSVSTLAHIAGVTVGFFVFAGLWLFYGIYQPSAVFPVRTIITIPEGTTLTDAAQMLEHEGAIRSALALRIITRFMGDGVQVQAGDYFFDRPLHILEITKRVTRGEFGLEPIDITIPEGATTYQMAEIFADKLMRFDPATFLMLAREKEGYLYPDTYTFLPNATVSQVLDALERTFYERIRPLEGTIAASGKPIHEIITMASLLEKEAWDAEERKQIAGVLWHRIDINMPLQVDAVFGYIKGTNTFNPKFSDLEIDSPYNTYKNKGLPPGPIGSPSISSIEAAAQPVPTDALFYLHGKDGVLRVSKNFKEHLANRRKYLD